MRDIDNNFNSENVSGDTNEERENFVLNSADDIADSGQNVNAAGADTEVSGVINSDIVKEEDAGEAVNDTNMDSAYQRTSTNEEACTRADDSLNRAEYFSDQPDLRNDSTNGNNEDEYQKMRDKASKKAAKKEKRAVRKNKNAAKEKKGHGVFFKGVAFVACAVMLGVISAGTFLGVIHMTGYDDKLEAAIEAADNNDNSAVHVNTVTTNGTASGSITAESAGVSSVVENVMPCIVSITSKIIYESQGYGFFFNGGTYEASGAGSGIIIGQNDSELLIVTNYHVIENATSLVVSFIDGSDINATVKGVSEDNDLAVVAVSLSDVSESTINSIGIATFGDSDSLKMGDRVIAIGNALGYGQSVTVGYISALSREVTIDGNTMTLLQTDAAINPGNSGGALINERGELIGINSAKYSDTDVEGMGFAIPISSVKELIEELMNKEPLVEVDESQASYLGITPADVNSSSAYLYNMPEGVYVYSLTEDGPAARSGLQEKDIITKFDGEKITSSSELQEILKYYAGGTTVDITVQRIVNGQYQEFVIPVELGFKSDYQSESSASGIN